MFESLFARIGRRIDATIEFAREYRGEICMLLGWVGFVLITAGPAIASVSKALAPGA